MATRTLGLDIGTNSVGWAVINVPESDDESGEVIAIGSRVFPEGAEVAGSALRTKGAERRQKRTLRRQVQRRATRKQAIRHELERIGMLPVADDDFAKLMELDPAELLAASDAGKELTLRQIGRVVYWFASRRGFLSLRTGGSTVIDDDDPSATHARYRLSQFSAETGERIVIGQEDALIEFLRSQGCFHPPLTDEVIFGRRGRMSYPVAPISRDDFLAGPDATLLDEFGLHGLVFFQRAVFWHQSSIGLCSLDPERGHPRAARAERIAQQYRVWKTIIDLRVQEDMRSLDERERVALHEVLSAQKQVSFGKIRKLLGLAEHEPINFDDGAKKALAGDETEASMRTAVGERWSELSETERDDVVHVLLGNGTVDEQQQQLRDRFGLTMEAARAATSVSFPTGRAKYSRSTIRALLPHMPDAATERDAIAAAGFRTPEQARAERGFVMDDVTNPMVRAALVQVRKVVEAVAAEYGHPDADIPFDVVRVELARDVRANAADRFETTRRNRAREAERKRLAEQIDEFAPGQGNNRDLQRRVRLWQEQQQRCLYTGTVLTLQMVLDGTRTQVDHILPRSRTLNNSDANVALVTAEANQAKGDRTIFEWAGQDKVIEVAHRARELGVARAKVRNIEREEVPTDTIPESLIITTGYINALARDLVKEITGCKVEVSRGRLTGELRYMTGLTKDHDDHRRHGLDAAMVALTTPKVALGLAKRYRLRTGAGISTGQHGAWEPWPGARSQIETAYAQALVSHKPMRKVSGQFVEDTRYGRVTTVAGEQRWARRRNLESGLTRSQFKEIADPEVKRCLERDLLRRGQDPSAAKLMFDMTDPPRMTDGTPIRSVRCHMNLPSNIVMKSSEPNTSQTPAGNQAAGLVRKPDGKHRLVFINRFEAQQRRNRSPRDWLLEQLDSMETLLFTLAIGETFSADNQVRVVTGLEPSSGQIWTRHCEDSSDVSKTRLSAAFFNRADTVEKVVITPAGLIRTASD